MLKTAALLALCALAGCAYEMNPAQVRRAYRACDHDEGLAYVRVDTYTPSVRSKCRNGRVIKVPPTE